MQVWKESSRFNFRSVALRAAGAPARKLCSGMQFSFGSSVSVPFIPGQPSKSSLRMHSVFQIDSPFLLIGLCQLARAWQPSPVGAAVCVGRMFVYLLKIENKKKR